jgi:hypothetical protein
LVRDPARVFEDFVSYASGYVQKISVSAFFLSDKKTKLERRSNEPKPFRGKTDGTLLKKVFVQTPIRNTIKYLMQNILLFSRSLSGWDRHISLISTVHKSTTAVTQEQRPPRRRSIFIQSQAYCTGVR